MSVKRALWLMNHTTLRNFEVPLLLEWGYEVFCPKIYQYKEGDGSASISWEYDETLTIPRNVLDKLNKVDFYGEIDDETLELINTYFDVAFFAAFIEQIYYITKRFKGVLVFRPFGVENPLTYSLILQDVYGPSFLRYLEKIGNRFFFGQSYENLSAVEYPYFKTRAIDLPIGMKNTNINHIWTGTDKRILFVCPKINSNVYYKNVYEKFKSDFKGFDYVIGGAQPIEVKNDKNILGFLKQEEFDANMRNLAVMFYHSNEPRHIHYHPFEALRNGMPLIYMADGLMDLLGGKHLPGRCKNIKEARKKIKRIMRNDTKFIEKVVNSQSVLLEKFKYDYCKSIWFKNMQKIDTQIIKTNQLKLTLLQKRKKIGIILPEAYTGGVLDFTIRLIKSLKKNIEENNDPIDIILGHVENDIFINENSFEELKNMEISIRSFTWHTVSSEFVFNTFLLKKYPLDTVEGSTFSVMKDDINYFEDCDYLIFTADRIPYRLFSLCPYGVVVHDCIQRFVPETFPEGYYEDSYIHLQRKADKVFVTSEPTYNAVIQYSGVNNRKINTLPLMFDLIPESEKYSSLDIDYFMWSTNITPHKNHLFAFHSLLKYYENGGTLKCVITGANTELFLKEKLTNTYIKDINSFIEKNIVLKKNIIIMGNVSKTYYYDLLSEAKFMFHPGYADNGNGASVDAACLGVPTVSSRYPGMEYINKKLGLNMIFFELDSTYKLAECLLDMEANYKKYAKLLPSRQNLSQHTIDGTYKEVYKIIRPLIM